MNLLIFLTHPEPTRSGYEKYLAPRHPELTIKTFGTRDEALKHVGWADILMCFGPQVGPEFFRDTPKLKWVHSLGTGTDGITDSPHLGKDVVVTATRGIHGVPMSEMAFLMMLAFNRDLRRIERQRGEQKWERYPGTLLTTRPSASLASARSPRTWRRASRRSACAWSASRAPIVRSRASTRSIRARRSCRPRPSSTISCCWCRSRRRPRNIVNDKVLFAMKPTSFLINLARGGVLDEDALLRALQQNKIAGAALDALATEPLPKDNPLWSLPNVYITPHIGGFCDTYVRMRQSSSSRASRPSRRGSPRR